MIAKRLAVSESDIKTAFESRIDEFSTQETRNIRQMVFDDKARAKDAPITTSGEEFDAVAADMLNWTEDDTNLGAVSKSALDPALAEIASSNVGNPAGPVETAFGQHIILVEKITMGGQAVLADVKEKIIGRASCRKIG